MSEPTPNAPAAVPPPLITWENRLPSWQQWINSFCENWIFAFIIAMAIRHFCVEAFRIPTASMEPMLYGDPAFSKSDHVVVDKFFFRFTGPSRWDVTVFQFPQPEIEPRKDEGDARTAITADESRLDTVMLRPLMYRNFVKRAVILPGDTYYIANGNIYLKQPDGSFQASRKPESVQKELWQEVYRFGVQPDYQPWLSTGNATTTIVDGALRMSIGQGQESGISLFPQQFRNLYLKPGKFRVRSKGGGADELIDLSMTSPHFTYRGTNTSGIAWDLDHWEVRRMNSTDLDHYDQGDANAGTLLNVTMDEWVGDVRFRARVSELTGTVALDLTQGPQRTYRMELSPTGWALVIDGKKIASGNDSLIGTDLVFGHLDDQIYLTLGGKELTRQDVPPINPFYHHLGARWNGSGSITFSNLAMDRDVHYTLGNHGSFLRPEAIYYSQMKFEADALIQDPTSSSFRQDISAKAVRDLVGVRAQMLGKSPAELTGEDRYRDIGNSPQSALTAPPGAYLLMGDNSPQSWDSRCWGYVASENLRGRVLAVVLPYSRWRVVR
jgi:signal peptidase I